MKQLIFIIFLLVAFAPTKPANATEHKIFMPIVTQETTVNPVWQVGEPPVP